MSSYIGLTRFNAMNYKKINVIYLSFYFYIVLFIFINIYVLIVNKTYLF